MDAKQAGNLGDGAAVLVDELAGEQYLRGVEGRARPKTHAASLGGNPPGTGALDEDPSPMAKCALCRQN
jgi:hypothetical protein